MPIVPVITPSVNQMLAARAAYEVLPPTPVVYRGAQTLVRQGPRMFQKSLRGKRRGYKYLTGSSAAPAKRSKAFFGELLEKNFFLDPASATPVNQVYTILPWRDAGASTGAGLTRLVLSSIDQGSGKSQRTGRQINMKKIHFRVGCRLKALSGTSDGQRLEDIRVRVLLVAWESTNSASVDTKCAGDILDTTFTDELDGFPMVAAYRNTDEGQNYHIFYDKTKNLRIEPGRTTWDTVDSAIEQLRPNGTEAWFKADVAIPEKYQNVRYDGTGGDISNHVSRCFVMYYFFDTVLQSDSWANISNEYRGTARVRYTA